tara:strand:+ start:250 stop:972 length:723 start_codon:yes stop_codon:yes gene_type:complete
VSSASWQPSGLFSGFRQSGFERWWSMEGEWVEEQNQRRGGESGVKLLPPLKPGQPPLYSKRQVGHLFRSLRHPFGLPTVLREEQALIACEQLGVTVPKRVFCAARKQQGRWQALLITEELRGFVSLDQWYAEHAPKLDEHGRKAVLRRLALVLQRLHRGRRQHGCLYSKHVYIRLTAEVPEVALLDLEKSRIRLLRSKAINHDLSQLRRHRGGMPEADWNYLLECYHNPQLEYQVDTDEA